MSERNIAYELGEAIGALFRKYLGPDDAEEPASSAEPESTSPVPEAKVTAKQARKPKGNAAPKNSNAYPGDYEGVPPLSYAPIADDLPDPGEVVWAWVPFEEDYTQGKDRPALIVGSEGDWLLGCMLTSQDHDIDQAQENAEGRYWVEVGTGEWDKQGRVSEVRVDRVLRFDNSHIRRIGGRLSEDKFNLVAEGIRRYA
ncbi:MAG: type II toxin-antitoxin system PemK/MazF family toxin [Propionibacteriaceae bacterium]|jgi:hypothetical protein|nr:type II toxin-antitoxin system PemK/MazF family toxin [Propionibacteriaceae bacterium]